MVVVRKPNGNLRICIDPKDLYKVLKTQPYRLPTIEDILPDHSRAKVFSTFDVKNGVLAHPARWWEFETDHLQYALCEVPSTAATFWALVRPWRIPKAPTPGSGRDPRSADHTWWYPTLGRRKHIWRGTPRSWWKAEKTHASVPRA